MVSSRLRGQVSVAYAKSYKMTPRGEAHHYVLTHLFMLLEEKSEDIVVVDDQLSELAKFDEQRDRP